MALLHLGPEAYAAGGVESRPPHQQLAAIKAPVTVLYAWDETMGQPQSMADDLYKGAYEGLPAARLQRMDGSYHFIMLDQPEAFAKAVTAFLD
jgi:pimeloyl-ACP methyl ester carboxylesterase